MLATPHLIAERPLASYSNYPNSDPGKSISKITNFGSILYQSIYPGIDVRFYARGQHVEHDFLLGPGADPNTISLRMEGIEHAAITSSGDVELAFGTVKLYESAPIAWQVANGERHSIRARWKLLSENHLGISLADYDRNLPVTIDPVLAYSTHLGGNTAEDISLGTTSAAFTGIVSVALDAAGNVYVAGDTNAVDFPTTAVLSTGHSILRVPFIQIPYPPVGSSPNSTKPDAFCFIQPFFTAVSLK
jgi:hypothetical protein